MKLLSSNNYLKTELISKTSADITYKNKYTETYAQQTCITHKTHIYTNIFAWKYTNIHMRKLITKRRD